MDVILDNEGYGEDWTEIRYSEYVGYRQNMSGYHMHTFYEISLIESGNVNVLLPSGAVGGKGARLVLISPLTPHYMRIDTDVLYTRKNVAFDPAFVKGCERWIYFRKLFGRGGTVVGLDDSQVGMLANILGLMSEESDGYRRQLLLMYYLSHIQELSAKSVICDEAPPCVARALLYIERNYGRKFEVTDIAWEVGVGRTTLLTAFKKYTGVTIGDYTVMCRLRHATAMLSEGATLYRAAGECGFGCVSNMIRCYKRRFGMTPGRYVRTV